jgi:hydrogenase nickel incorporation protein HypB
MNARVITVERDILADVRSSANEFRQARTECGTLVVNLLSSPGAGKTSLLEATAKHWRGRRRATVLVGDIATDRDAQRLAPWIDVVQMTTGGACHLEFPLVARAFAQLPQSEFDFLFIENVGNLVCPASHDLGEHLRVVLLGVTEGDDKPAKYPKMFRTSQALVISKVDLLPHVPFSVNAATSDARSIQPDLTVLPICSLSGEGLEKWCAFLDSERNHLLQRRQLCAAKP